ncbi:MAG TPA: prepilin-type N-terminal cleavage/methylation domain-containing protein [Candidatus Ozemobacteraceae bacterium]|nr:prepilin-type N-terminal cleavage/methylation domain-containing protein [Candidatus Ozemobacteraceae bacterium]
MIRRRGFSFVEVLVAILVLSCFLLPLTRHITHVRRISLGARDSVMANTLLASCLADFRSVPFDDLGNPDSATYTRILDRYRGVQIVGQFICEINITIQPGSDHRIKVISLDSTFRMPGIQVAQRALELKGFMVAPPQ